MSQVFASVTSVPASSLAAVQLQPAQMKLGNPFHDIFIQVYTFQSLLSGSQQGRLLLNQY